jgi:hypothetical protein
MNRWHAARHPGRGKNLPRLRQRVQRLPRPSSAYASRSAVRPASQYRAADGSGALACDPLRMSMTVDHGGFRGGWGGRRSAPESGARPPGTEGNWTTPHLALPGGAAFALSRFCGSGRAAGRAALPGPTGAKSPAEPKRSRPRPGNRVPAARPGQGQTPTAPAAGVCPAFASRAAVRRPQRFQAVLARSDRPKREARPS